MSFSSLLFAVAVAAAPTPSAPARTDARSVLWDEGIALGSVRFNLKGQATPTVRQFTLDGAEVGQDGLGAFQASRYRLTAAGAEPADRAGATGTMVLRHYQGDLTVAELAYEGPALQEDAGAQAVMTLPGFARGMAITRYNPYWTGPAFASDFRLLPDNNALMLWRGLDQRYHVLLPLTGASTLAEVGKSNDRFGVHLSGGPGGWHRAPLFALVTDWDPYVAVERAEKAAFALSGASGAPIEKKRFPAAYKGLGWCSWNAWGSKVDEKALLESAEALKNTGVPFGFFLIDDGWMTVDGQRLTGHLADPAKFPHGLGWLTQRVRTVAHTPHVGVWHTLHGYWDGVAPGSPAAAGHRLFAGNDGVSFPHPGDDGGFYDAWYQALAGAGIDFTKVDGQGNTARFVKGRMALAEASAGAQHNVEAAAARHMAGGLMDCMAMQPENAYNWATGALVRTSNDYEPDVPQTTKEHIFQNAYNTLWTNAIAWPDFDMFQSDRPDAEVHAVARAISGGPVYVSDKPGHINVEILKRLTLSDGSVLRPDHAAHPTEDVLLRDTAIEDYPLKLSNQVVRPGFVCGIVALFNVNKSLLRVQGPVFMEDFEVPGDRHKGDQVMLYDRVREKLHGVGMMQATRAVVSSDRPDVFWAVHPRGRVAPLGLLDKYMGPAAVTDVVESKGRLDVGLREGGRFGAWSAEAVKEVRVDGRQVAFTLRDGLLKVEADAFGGKPGPRRVTLSW